MKTLKIQRSRKKSVGYLVLSAILLGFIIYLFITDKKQYPNGNAFYWVGIGLFGLTTFYFSYDVLNRAPLYIIDDNGIYTGRKKIAWVDLFYFQSQTRYSRYISPKEVLLFDRNGNKVLTIDLTLSDMPLDRFERILKMKLRKLES